MSERYNELIVVPGHALFRDEVKTVPRDVAADRHWELQEFQSGEPPLYIEHILRGLEILKDKKEAALMFSGGRTRPGAEKWSEASTYAAIAAESSPEASDRVFVEPYAADSQQNLEFSLEQFRRYTGRLPLKLLVVGWSFKAERFRLHAHDLGIPASSFGYEGVNNPQNLAIAEIGEDRVLQEFKNDPFAEGAHLLAKRQTRNPHGDVAPYHIEHLPLKKAS